jgi:hypothetical protein
MGSGAAKGSDRIALVVLCALSFALIVSAALMVARLDPGRTGARIVRFIGPDGKEIPRDREGERYPFEGCHGDIGFTALVHRGALWTTCGEQDQLSYTALARIDPAAGEARLNWRFPASLPLAHTLAIAPGPNGELGIVYRHSGANGPLAAGIAGTKGWQREPVALDAGASSEVLGAAWVDGAFQVVVRGGSDIRAMLKAEPRVITVGAGLARSPFLSTGPVCPDERSWCTPSMAFRRDNRWWLVVETGKDAVELSRDGTRRTSAWHLEKPFMLSEKVENSVAALLKRPSLASHVLGPDGALHEPAAGPPAPFEVTYAWNYYDTDAGYLRHRILWAATVPFFTSAQALGDHVIALAAPERDENMHVLEITDPKRPRETIVAKTTVFSCGELQVGTFLPRPGGGHFLVDPSGCYLALGDDLTRADPLGLLEHLRRRGSIGIDWNERSHAWMLAWVLFGLPLATLITWAVAWLWSRARKREPMPWPRRLVWGAGVYVVTAGWMLLRLVPLFT